MPFNSDRGKAAALVALVFALGIAFGVVGALAGRRVLNASNRSGDDQDQQISQLVHDLKLTPDQERDFRKTLADTRDRYDAIRKEFDPQLRQVREENQDKIREILTPEQRPEFENFLNKFRNQRSDQNNRKNDQVNRGGNPNSHNDQTPQVARLTQELHLTADQQSELAGILRDTRASLDALRQQMNPQFEEVRLQNRARLREIVNPEQRQGLDSFFERRDEERRRR